jgi:L-cysteine:1D-myo-inositol 2-amino-2-deoxy-alpha-D-glucopyranoside ligase
MPERTVDADVPAMMIYDTKARAVVPFEVGPIVTMYTCGITPYASSHLGHAAVYLTYDVLQRRLRDRGHETRCVRNYTDVDDDILRKARELGVHYLDLAASQIAVFDRDMTALGLIEPYSAPRATSAIADIRRLIGQVLDNGHAYQAGGGVYFSVSSFESFGSVSGYDRDRMLELAAEHGGNPDDPNKRDPLDFILWQPSAADEPAWDSLWGRAVLVGTSNARPWPCASSKARPSTFMAGEGTWCSPITNANQPRAKPHRARRSFATGCTKPWCAWMARR